MRSMAPLLFALLSIAPASAEPRNPLDALRFEDLSATRDRPLFAPTRRQPPPVRVEAPPPEPTPAAEIAVVLGPPPFQLIGAVVGRREAYALLRNKTTNQVTRLRTGDEADGWRVEAIGIRTVALERSGRKEFIALSTLLSPPAGAELAGEPQPEASAPTALSGDAKPVILRPRLER
jgi:hypothetical protein